jgi:dolichol-phosphate mannosyltransferase
MCPTPAVVTPTYNEAENIERFARGVFAALPGATLFVVDDGSPDGTAAMVEALDGGPGAVRVLRRAGKQGLASAYRHGMGAALEAGFDPIFQMDADLSHDPADLPRLAAAGADLAIGSRYVTGGGTRNWPLSRKLISRAGGTYARLVLGLPVKDPTGGFKCWRAGCLRGVELQKVGSEGYVFQVETTWRALQRGYTVVEVPIVFTERAAGASKMSAAIAREAAWRVPALRLRRQD